MKAIHWRPKHDVVTATGTRLAGWPVCCSGDRCVAIKHRGMMNSDLIHVTCRACMRVAAAAARYAQAKRRE